MYCRYRGHPIRPSRTANQEMVDHRIYLDDVQKILEEGRELSRSVRKRGTVEKALRIRGRMIKVVAVESITLWNNEKVWLIIHVGDTSER